MASRKLKSTTPLPWSASDAASAEGPSSSTVSNVSAFLRRRRGSTILFTLLAGLAFITLSQLPPGPFFSGSYAPKSDAREAVNPLQSEIAQSLKQQLSSFSEVRDNWVAFPGSATSPLVHDLPRHSARKTINERLLSDACADLFISKGELCRLSPSEATELQDQSRLSVLYTYVNGSDPILSEIRTSLIESEDVQGRGGSPRHYRAHAELIHSIRSTLRAFAKHLNDHLASIHIYTTDLPDPYLTHRPDGSLNPPAEKDRRWGYKPTWLSNVQKQWKHGNVDLRMEFPWNTYRAHNLSLQEAHLWRDAALPTFQSMSVESQIPHLETDRDLVLGLCDDFFFLKELAASDVATPFFGGVYHLQNHLLVQPATAHQFAKGDNAMDGEWASLGYAELLLDGRFGRKKRPYPTHHFKSFNMPVMKEIAQAFDDELRETAMTRFRGQGTATEVNMAFMSINWTIERAREALIWSFIVAKMDTNRDGILDPSERRRMFDYLLHASIPGGEEATTDFIPIVRPHRETTADIIDPVLDHAGLNRPRETRYANSFASHGYAYLSNQRDSQYNYEDYDKWAGEGWAKFDYNAPDSTYCELKLSCFEVAQGSEATTDNIFKNFAFRRPECGNCLIAAGLRLSGKIGFEAFLPPSSSQYTVNHHDDVSHVLPITKTWQEADFSLREVVPKQADLRALCVRMLQRYPWVVGDISTTFIKMNGPRETEFKLKSFISFEQEKVRGSRSVALLALNDDIKTEQWSARIDQTLNKFYAKHFPDKADWEA